jgi:hypothetical protein
MSPLPVLMVWDEVIDMSTAVRSTGKSSSTIRRLCRRHGLARQTYSNAPLEISIVGLEMALHGDTEALELLRQGRRTDERVLRYLRHMGFSG